MYLQAAFLLPVLSCMLKAGLEGSRFSEQQEPAAIVMGPTRELVVQIWNEARKFSFGTMLRPCVVYGGTSVGHQLREIEKGCHIVVGTPGRLLDFIGKGKVRVHYCVNHPNHNVLSVLIEKRLGIIIQKLESPIST